MRAPYPHRKLTTATAPSRPAPSRRPLKIKNTIQRDLAILWAFIALIALVLAFLLLQLSRQGAPRRSARPPARRR
jgi:hypothetical protein